MKLELPTLKISVSNITSLAGNFQSLKGFLHRYDSLDIYLVRKAQNVKTNLYEHEPSSEEA